jgi:hypothetical protein
MRASYTYVDDDRAIVTRPAAMHAVEALRALCSGDASYFFQWSGISRDLAVVHGVDDMMRLGWRRLEGEFRAFKQGIWSTNDLVLERLLRDM